MNQTVSWIHFGDLHISDRNDANYDFLLLIDEANRQVKSGIDFALLPGDNADDGAEDQYQLVKAAISGLHVPLRAITGDHDMAEGSLALFRRYLSDTPFQSFRIGEYRFFLLNSVAHWQPPVFGLGEEQMAWLRQELASTLRNGERSVAFLHAYPSEHSEGAELSGLFRDNGVLLIEMGHTHYNELANDGGIVYATTRSTEQIEEGPPGFSVTALDNDVVSWKFKPIGEWPLVLITSPADERLIVNPESPSQVLRGQVAVRARVWGNTIDTVTMSVDDGTPLRMEAVDECTWTAQWDTAQSTAGSHVIAVAAATAEDRIIVNVNQHGSYRQAANCPVDYENTVGAWQDKHILGTQLGPNENGHGWPPRRERERINR